MKIYLISLGCARNLVDSEIVAGILKDNNFNLCNTVKNADIAIVNTCAFIDEAKEESIDVILQLAHLKNKGDLKKIVVIGCLPARYFDEIRRQLPEVDAIVGFDSYPDIHKIIRQINNHRKVYKKRPNSKFIYDETLPRLRFTPGHYSYVKISEGCVHRCTYCIIPKIKGPYRSRPIDSILREITKLIKQKTKEVVLIGQDTTSYGIDIYKKPMLSTLLGNAASIRGLKWLRLLYGHPAYFNDDVIACFERFKNICKYVDMPLQHINHKILKLMRRPSSQDSIIKLIKNLRARIPGVALRTTFIVGFPHETQNDFNELIKFVKDVKFERLGVFKYSREDGTKAYPYQPQVSERVKSLRYDKIMSVQRGIAQEVNRSLLKKKIPVMIDKKIRDENDLYLGRTEYDAPEVDGQVYLRSRHKNLTPGSIVDALVTDIYEYDLVAKHN